MNYLLDSNILVNSIRRSALYEQLSVDYALYKLSNLAFISEVTIGELYSLAYQGKWGLSKRNLMEYEIRRHSPQRISYQSIYEAYADIDAYSQCKHPNYVAPAGLTARNMGKNDLWIAATAYVTGATLLTTDGDFDHLEDLISFIRIVP
jgi:tRNA(fMet)-specific endonuclease VapC